MDLSYYPGCSLESSAREYNMSAISVATALGINLIEIEDWICCGATSAHSTSQILAHALSAKNLALAQNSERDLAVPCASCYSRLKRSDHILRNDPEKRREIEEIVNFKFTGRVNVMSLLETFSTRVRPEEVAKRTVRPLSGLKLVCYYGCLLVRPHEITRFDKPENPQSLDKLMKCVGASPLKWSYKTECCGASLCMTSGEMVKHMVTRLLEMAEEAGAQAIVTACPLCQMNLEIRREDGIKPMPSFYFTELMGLAMGLEGSASWFAKHIVDPFPLLRSLSLVK